MGKIRRLAAAVRDQIAAGEVVERPASVVKELIENSLDAGARRIEVEVAGGGKERIRVRDDGVGMDADDLPLAVERHATSKLSVMGDLARGETLGFRGEALAAIAAVSRLTIISRPRTANAGTILSAGPGPEGQPTPTTVAAPVGTHVEVSDLFYSVPARLKHLKSDAAELSAIHQLVLGFALGYPDIAFQCRGDDRLLVDTPGDGSARTVVLAAYGAEVAEAALALDFASADESVRIHGLVVPPHLNRASRSAQAILVNGRLVRNWPIRSALEEAFRPGLPDRRYPMAWVHLTIPPERLDPNVHPQKTEVRIDGERRIAALVYRAVADLLADRAKAPALSLGDASRGGFEAAEPTVGQTEALFMWRLAGTGAREDGGVADDAGLSGELRQLRPLGQWRHKYILAEGPGGLYLVDQHAAQERVFYERFRARMAEVRVQQPLLVPIALTLTPEGQALYEEFADRLGALGFDMAPLGGRTVVLRGVPRALTDLRVDAEVIESWLGELATRADPNHPVLTVTEEAAALAACKAAIKAYRPLEPPEVSRVLADLAAAEDPRTCPHGRPTTLCFSLEEVDRRFGRKG